MSDDMIPVGRRGKERFCIAACDASASAHPRVPPALSLGAALSNPYAPVDMGVTLITARGVQQIKGLRGASGIVIRPSRGTNGFMRPDGQLGQG